VRVQEQEHSEEGETVPQHVFTAPAVTAPVPVVAPSNWKLWHTLSTLGIVAAIVAVGAYASASKTLATSEKHLVLWTFVGLVALMTAFIAIVGHGLTRSVGGALIDGQRGRMSLSRLQMTLWTILILSAYLTAFIVNISSGIANPLKVAIPPELLLAMGISTTSLVGSSLILRNQATTGTVLVQSPASAGWRNVFEADDVGAGESLDLGKIQMFYFTVVLILGYGIALGNLFAAATAHGVSELPKLDEAFVALLALSHAGYLVKKAVAAG
jgi:hypothetical protein